MHIYIYRNFVLEVLEYETKEINKEVLAEKSLLGSPCSEINDFLVWFFVTLCNRNTKIIFSISFLLQKYFVINILCNRITNIIL